MSANIQNLYRQVIMDHYKNPKNKGIPRDEGFHEVHLKNPTCGDDVMVAVKLKDDIVSDVKHDGTGCAICCASASVMSETLVSLPVEKALYVTSQFYELVKGESVDEGDMGDAFVFAGVSQFPARIKCATIAWKAFETAIDELQT